MSQYLMHARSWRALPIIVFAGLITSGCRSYGGHGAEEATYRQMQVAHQVFEEELVRARADLNRLGAGAANADVLGILAAQYEQIVRGHEAVLDVHAELIVNLSADSEYRDLHRTFGAIVAQQRTIRRQYEGVLRYVQEGYMQQDTIRRVERPYSLVPPYYTRVAKQQREISVGRVLAEVRSGRAPASGFQITMPASGSEASGGVADSSAAGH